MSKLLFCITCFKFSCWNYCHIFPGLVNLSKLWQWYMISVYSGTLILQTITISETVRSTFCTPVWRCLVMPWPSMRIFCPHVCSGDLGRKAVQTFPVYRSYYNKLHDQASTVYILLKVKMCICSWCGNFMAAILYSGPTKDGFAILSGDSLNIKMLSYNYRNSHYKDKRPQGRLIIIQTIFLPASMVFIFKRVPGFM